MNLLNLPKMPKSLKINYCHPGDKKRPLYNYKFDEKYGCPRRVLNGYMDQQEYIQQSADDVDFKAIGKMLVDNRDNVITHFTSDTGEIIDVTGQPRNIHEYNNLQNKMREEFEAMPTDIKALFANDFDTFSKSYRNGTLGSTLETYYKSKVEPAPTEEGEK